MSVVEFPGIRVAPLQADELEVAAEFVNAQWRETYRGVLPKSRLAERTAAHFADQLHLRRSHCWLAWSGKRLIGLISTQSNAIEDLWVARRYRRRGVASRLMETAVDALAARGFQHAQIGCEDFNEPLLGFLRARNWSEVGQEAVAVRPGVDVMALVFSRRLTAQRAQSQP